MQSIATLFLSIICFAQGQLHQATRYHHEFIRKKGQQETYPASILANLPMAMILYEWNELATLQQHVQQALELAEQFSSIPQILVHMAVKIPLACLQHAQGETKLAIRCLIDLWEERLADENDFPFYLYQEALYWLVRFSLMLGDQPGAQHWLNELARCYQQYGQTVDVPRLQAPAHPSAATPELVDNTRRAQESAHVPLHLQEQKMLLTARIALVQGKAEDALAMLDALLPETRTSGRGHNLLQIKLLMAQAYAACKQPSQARQWLLDALEQGYPEGYQRSFLDEGEQLVPLLRDLLPHLRSEPLRAYAQKLLHCFARLSQRQEHDALNGVEMLIDPLSSQEQRVLRLLVAGRSNPEIARELVVSVNTIRTQIQSIYRKLQVNNRRAASEVARQLHIG